MDHIKYVRKDNDIKSIAIWRLPFKITKSKCRSYLDLHYHDLKVNDEILSKCKYIFITLLRYIGGCYETDNDFRVWPIRDSLCHNLNYKDRFTLNYKDRFTLNYKDRFKVIFFTNELKVQCSSNCTFYDCYDDYTIKDLLFDDYKYEDFINRYYSYNYDYYNIFNVIKLISIKLNYEIPEELINEIICFA